MARMRRTSSVILAASCLLVALPAGAQGRAPRSPTDRAVELRQGAPDLAFDSRLAAGSPANGGSRPSDAWTPTSQGQLMIGVGSLFLAGSAVLAGFAVHAGSRESPDPYDQADAEATATGLGAGAVATGLIGLGLAIPGVVLIAGDDGPGDEVGPRATARLGGLGAAIDVCW